eukprot:TRINITY_DN3130_c0_g1_i1.p1 TRINITY_DN3130_c0_g1~~TRINITY_DN3130_c0_g1_i1.p1  ORF type:complete len:462 (+),score=76.37 TRINITY_DN3130_c0_g1_i1:211-1596(+)
MLGTLRLISTATHRVHTHNITPHIRNLLPLIKIPARNFAKINASKKNEKQAQTPSKSEGLEIDDARGEEGFYRDPSEWIKTDNVYREELPEVPPDMKDPHYVEMVKYMRQMEAEVKSKRRRDPQEKMPSIMPDLYYYSDRDLDTYFPEGPAGGLAKNEWANFVLKGCVVREHSHQVVEWMQDARKTLFANRDKDSDYYTILHGDEGVGKSCLLNPIVHWARQQGWIVVFIPDGAKWTTTGFLIQSKRFRDSFEQPLMAWEFCLWQISAHGRQYEKIPLRTNPVIEGFDLKGKTILDLLKIGTRTYRRSTEVIYHLKRELCTVTEHPVAFIIDGVNLLNSPETIYQDPLDDRLFCRNLPASRLVLSKIFSNYKNHGLANGVYVGTTSMSCRKENEPFALELQKDEKHVVNIPRMNRFDYHKMTQYYYEAGYSDEPIPTEAADYFWLMTAGRGSRLFKIASLM